MTNVAQWVRDMVPPCPYGVGDIVKIKGKPCKITGGQYWGTYGLSNHWSWREVLPNGNLGVRQSGYGGNWPIIQKKGKRHDS